MDQIVAFNSTLAGSTLVLTPGPVPKRVTVPLSVTNVLQVAVATFPDVDFSGVNTLHDLDVLLMTKNIVFYVTIDRAAETSSIQAKEKALSDSIAATIGPDTQLSCDDNPPAFQFTQADLNIDTCTVPVAEYPVTPTVDPKVVDNLQAKVDAILQSNFGAIEGNPSVGGDDVSRIQQCVSDMGAITNNINALLVQERNLNELMNGLQEILFNYRIMGSYFAKREQTLSKILKTFDPLLLKVQELKLNILNVQTQITTQEQDPQYQQILQALGLNTSSGVSGVSGTSGVSGVAPVALTVAQLTQSQQVIYNAVLTLQTQLAAYQAQLVLVDNQIALDKSNISAFMNVNLTVGTEIQRQVELNNQLDQLFSGSGSNTVYSKVSAFSTRTNITTNKAQSINGRAFSIKFYFTFRDPTNLLKSHKKLFLVNDYLTNITNVYKNGSKGGGVLYDSLYNIWDNLDLFFTPEERGLTTDSNSVAPEVKGTTSAQVSGGLFIADLGAYSSFYTNFPTNFHNRVQLVVANTVEPALTTLVASLENFAVQEVQYVLAYGLAFQDLPSQSQGLKTIIQDLHDASGLYLSKMNDLVATLTDITNQHNQILLAIEKQKQMYSSVSCAGGASTSDFIPPAPGSDPLGITSLSQVNPQLPDITKYCYWLKFSLFATAVNLLPLITKYWPIGLLIPTPDGITRIPLPIVWIPLAVISLPVGVFVIFIAECGLCPSPVVFYVGPSGEKKFIISLRPGTDFGSAITNMPTVKIAVPMPIIGMLGVPGFNPDSPEALLADMTDKIMKKVRKLPEPDVSWMNRLPTNATVSDKIDALKKVISNYINGLTVPDIAFPKNGSMINPKPTPISEIIDKFKQSAQMALPSIAIPPGKTIDLGGILADKIGSFDLSTINISIPPLPLSSATQAQINSYLTAMSKAMSSVAVQVISQITADVLGIMSQVTGNVNFFESYVCRPTTSGTNLPGIPPAVALALMTLNTLITSALNGLTLLQLVSLNNGIPITSASDLQTSLINLIKTIPVITLPDPSNISMQNMSFDSVLKIIGMQLPSLPDITAAIQPRINIPGAAIKGAMSTAVTNAIDLLPLSALNVINFPTVSPIDMKQIASSIIENSLGSLSEMLNPFMILVSLYKITKDKTFPEILGLLKASVSVDTVLVVDPNVLNDAMVVLKTLSIIPYPIVAAAPYLTNSLHPILNHDDLPPWERLSLSNFLFVGFLDEWCQQGKKTAGFFENPF